MHMQRLRPTREWIAVAAFFIVLTIIGYRAAGEISIPMDEPIMSLFGSEVDGYVTEGKPWPDTVERRYHGPLVEWGIYRLQQHLFFRAYQADATVLTPTDLAVIRHRSIAAIFIAGVFAFYLLCRKRFGDWRYAILGAAFLAFFPRIAGHALFNSRDIPHLVLFTLAMFFLFRFRGKPSILSAAALGLAIAADIAVRTMGVLLIPLLLFVAVTRFFEDRPSRGRTVAATLVALGVSAIFTVIFWPFLWEQPVAHFFEALRFSSTFNSVPLLYAPVWIAITMPPVLLLFFCVGIIAHIRSALYDMPSWLREGDVLVIAWWLAPLLMVFAGAGIYNDWRHIYFIAPALILTALDGLRWILSKSASWRLRTGLWAVTWAGVLASIWWAFAAFPMNYIYFNVPPSISAGFEHDYWSLSARPALDAIFAQDPRATMSVYATNSIVFVNAKIFYPAREVRQEFDPMIADYIIDASNDQAFTSRLTPDQLIATITAGSLPVARVYRVR